jgi:hypothetical protein
MRSLKGMVESAGWNKPSICGLFQPIAMPKDQMDTKPSTSITWMSMTSSTQKTGTVSCLI